MTFTSRHLSAIGAAVSIVALATANAEAKPALVQGVWQEITPSAVTTGAAETCIGQGIVVDRKNPSTIYWGTTPFTDALGGLFKTTDGGSTWARIAQITPAWAGASDHLDMPLHMEIDPKDSNHLYAGDGVRGTSQGFFVSTDGGTTFVQPKSFNDALTQAGIDNKDIYDVAVEPSDFSHILLSFHYRWGWDDTPWKRNSGVLESLDGGATWIVHAPQMTWGSGHSINFLYAPSLGIGDAKTWLLGTQDNGFWRTSNAGATWTQVTTTNITHGGGDIYYTSKGVLYAGGTQTVRSTDNGVTWQAVGPGSTWTVGGDGVTLYTGGGWGSNKPFQVSPESDGKNWKDYNNQNIGDGPYAMTYDSTNGIMYSSNWFSGVWALKVGDGTGVIQEPPTPVGGSGGAGGVPGVGGSPVHAATGGTPSAAGQSGSGANSGATSNSSNAGASSAPGDSGAGCACRATRMTNPTSQAGLGALGLGMVLAWMRRRRVATQ